MDTTAALLEQLDLNEERVTQLEALENYVRQLEWQLGIRGKSEVYEAVTKECRQRKRNVRPLW